MTLVHSFLILEQLSTFIAVIKSQFNDFGEDLFRTHFSTLHLLLSEMFDSGLPSSMEPNILGMIIQPFTTMNLAKALVSGGPTKMLSNLASSFGLAKGTMDIASPDSVINLNGIGEGMGVGSGYGTGSGISGSGSDTWWRRGSASYSKNEVLIDVLEKFNCCLDRDGKVLNGSISGEIQVQSHLSETPELRLTLRDPTLVADAALHSCVRMQRFERDNSICFCPPEGRFSLASYWIPNVKLPPPVLLRGSLSSSTIKNSAAAQFVVSRNYRAGRLDTTQKATCDLEDVAIRIHLPSFVTDSTITSSVGTTTFNVQDKTVFWSIGKLSQTMGAVPAEGTVSLESRQESSISSKCLSGTRNSGVPILERMAGTPCARTASCLNSSMK
ncbi:adaptor complexes medium subunit family protein [Cardiosporidium cionae]|uniref:Adaptor complexes medium subunit family protein n=1 Tax=Cardiosporidium cionae TaxID=476202 RepID=A0ABQ7JBT6_9APIC|nr:adaptor complexes medium subunit family protein [Cardiosporidium cionae]|eukprot:KAF8821400.1 adaptor complexes medium subunit family protein [Cardiosporidium cionae]